MGAWTLVLAGPFGTVLGLLRTPAVKREVEADVRSAGGRAGCWAAAACGGGAGGRKLYGHGWTGGPPPGASAANNCGPHQGTGAEGWLALAAGEVGVGARAVALAIAGAVRRRQRPFRMSEVVRRAGRGRGVDGGEGNGDGWKGASGAAAWDAPAACKAWQAPWCSAVEHSVTTLGLRSTGEGVEAAVSG